MLSKTYTKYIQTLHHKKFRDEGGVFIAEGPRLVEDLLQSGVFTFKSIIALPAWLEEHDGIVQKSRIDEIHPAEPFELEKISLLQTPNKVFAVVYKKEDPGMSDLKGKLTLMLDDIQDPGNMGTIIRIADWFGIKNILCSEGSADQYNPKVVQASMGSIARVTVFHQSLEEFLEQNTLPLFAATFDGEPLSSFGKVKEGIILIGNEGKGIHPHLLEHVSREITIPRFGGAESLNAAVATGIILSHFVG